MASIRKEILIEASTEHVWAAVRDVGALHQRLVPGLPTARDAAGSSGSLTCCPTSSPVTFAR